MSKHAIIKVICMISSSWSTCYLVIVSVCMGNKIISLNS